MNCARLSVAAEGSQGAFAFYDQWAQRAGGAPALITRSETVTYGELAIRVEKEQRRLLASDTVSRGCLRHADVPGSVDWVVTLLAGLNLGLEVVVPDQDWPREAIAEHTNPLLAEGADSNGDGGIWLFTSGTTKKPKPRFRSLALLRSDVARVHQGLPDDLRERRPASLCLLPLSHGFGLINSLLLIHAIGGAVLIDDIRDRQRIAQLLRDHDVEILYAWPSHLEALADAALWKQAKTRLRWCVSSALRLSEDVATRFAEAAGCPVRQQYGTTETGPLCLDRGDPPSSQIDCMGRPVAGVQFCVLGQNGEPLTGDAEGELAVKLKHLNLAADELTADGFWPTGDHGYCDLSGRIHVLGRLSPFTDERGPGRGECEGGPASG